MQCLDGVTSAIQTQLDNKASYDDATQTEIQYLSSVTSAIQTQLDNKYNIVDATNVIKSHTDYLDFRTGGTGRLRIHNSIISLENDTKFANIHHNQFQQLLGINQDQTIQDQLDTKLEDGDTVNGATPTKMGYLSGTTSAIQTQLDAKTTIVIGDTHR